MRADDAVAQKVDVLISAVDAARPAAVREYEEVSRAARGAEGGAALLEPSQALLLRDRGAARIVARKEDDDRGACRAPVEREEGALLDWFALVLVASVRRRHVYFVTDVTAH